MPFRRKPLLREVSVSSLFRKSSRRRSVVALFDRIDPAHRFLASLFFDHVCNQPGVRAIMKIPLNAARVIPRWARIALSTLIGNDVTS